MKRMLGNKKKICDKEKSS